VRSESEGSGLGLYISRELARSVGGDLRYVPTEHGATFTVIVPRVRASASAGKRRAS
jgi:signal transduction histidine kinase